MTASSTSSTSSAPTPSTESSAPTPSTESSAPSADQPAGSRASHHHPRNRHLPRRAASTLSATASKQLRLARSTPATIAFFVLLWTVGAATHSLTTGPSAAVREQFGAGVPALDAGRVHTLLTAALWAPDLVGYLLITLAGLAIVGAIERRLGTVRLVVVGLGTQVVGVGAGLFTVQLTNWADGTWSTQLVTDAAVGPSTMLVGIVLAYSAQAPALWRRRIRLGVLVILVILVLYGGLLQDVLRLSTALTGLAAGALILRRSPLRPPARSSRHETRTLVSVLLAASALGAVLAAFSSSATGPLSVLQYLFTAPEADPSTLADVCAEPSGAEACADLRLQVRFAGIGPTVLSVLPAVLVLVLAAGLRRGRAFAWWTAVALHVVLAGLGLLLGIAVLRAPQTDVAAFALDGTRGTIGVVGPLVQPLLVLGVLLWTRRSFDVSAPRGTYVRTGRLLAAFLAGAFAAYLIVGTALRDQFNPEPNLGTLVRDFPLRLVPAGYLGIVEPLFVPTSPAATVLFEWTGIALWSVVIAAVLRSFTRTRVQGTDGDAAAARALLVRYGDHALSYLSTWSGTSYWFTPSREAYIAYRVTGGVAIITGDPVGPAAERDSAVRGFAEFCDRNGWTPCLYSVTAALSDVAIVLGWERVQVAEETVLPLGELAFTGKKFQDVRTAVNKAAKAGITAEWISYPTAPRALTQQIEAVSEEWISGKGMPEMGFTLGGLDELDDPAVRCLIAVDADRTVHGITSWLPVHRDGHPIGWTLDFMRRRETGFKGVMEFLIGSAALAFQAEGAEFVSLSGAPLARLDPDSELTGVQKVLDVMGRTMEPVYGFRSLLAFKAKFQPRYRPLYMVYPELAVLPRIGNALAHAYLPHLTLRQGVRMMSRL